MSRRTLAAAGAVCLLSMVLALAGCAVGPSYVRPDVALNQAWTEANRPQLETQSVADSTWWTAFSDTTLNRLVRLAYQQNLSLQVAGLRIMEARAQLGIAEGRRWPQVQAVFGSATGVGLSEHAANNTAFLDRYYWDYQVGFDAAWEMDVWGKYRRGVQAESSSYLGAIADYDDALVSLTAEVGRTYVVVRTFEVLIQQAQENARLQEEGLRMAESRFRNGATSELDVTQATTLLEGTRATIPQLQTQLQRAQNALSTLLGQPSGAAQALLNGPQDIPTAPPEVAVSVPAEMLRRRPDIRAREHYAAAQSALVGVAKADLYPSFTLVGTIGSQASSSAGPLSGESTASDLFDTNSGYYVFGPRVYWPIFNYGRIKSNVRLQDARLQQLLIDYEDTVQKAAQEVEDGMIGFLRAQEAAQRAELAANGAQRSADLALVQYREGAVDFQRVLDAQRSLLEEENSLAQTRSSIATNLIALFKALGGGWELRQGRPFVADSTRVEMENRTNWSDLLRTTNGTQR